MRRVAGRGVWERRSWARWVVRESVSGLGGMLDQMNGFVSLYGGG